MAENSDPTWSRVDAILQAALERPEGERRRWVVETCGADRALAAEVLRLLELGSRDDGALDSDRLEPLWRDALGALDGEPLREDASLRSGQRIGAYEVLGVLGRGGMGTVYRARDTILGREVAVKALSSAFAGDPSGLKRFAREARLLASLNHPNIATIYDLLEVEGQPYLILELIEGETLADRIARGPLPLDQTLEIARQLVEALEEAHAKGVVHRDLKPSNVTIRPDKRVKVLDFGLAKSQAPALSGSSPSAATTRSGLVLGTPAYMSPEQARGHGVDLRTDIWSFGCLLYEMLTGERAFRGGSGFDVVASVLRDEVAWSRLPGGLPAGLQRLLRRCLEKDAAARPQAFTEVRQALDEAASAAFSAPRFLVPRTSSLRPVLIAAGLALTLALSAVVSLKLADAPAPAAEEPRQLRIAVLPFRNLDSGEGDDYLADGLTEDLISRLGRVQPSRLTVIARHSAMTYKGSRKQLDEIARELPVQYVVDGSVRRQDERLRITSRLVRVRDQATIWSESYDRRMGDLLDLQGEVADEIARRIRISVAPPQGGARVAASIAPAAYDAYLQGRYHQQRGSAASTARSLEEFQQAVALEPGFALAWAGLAHARIFSSGSPVEAQELARQAALEAVDIDGSSAEARIALGLVRLYADWDWDGARRELEQAVALDPGSPEGHFYLAQALAAAGRLDEAVASARRAQELDPFSPLIGHYVGRFFYYARDFDAALVELRRAIDLDPGYPWSELFLSLTLEELGRHEESLRHRQRALSLMGAPPFVVQGLRDAFEAGGFEGLLRHRAEDAEERAGEIGHVTSTELAQLWARLGEPDRALRWLERALDDHTRDLIYLAHEPALDPLRDAPAFAALLEKAGHPAAAPRS